MDEKDIQKAFDDNICQTAECTGLSYETFKRIVEYGYNLAMKGAVDGTIEGEWRKQEDAPYEVYAVSDELDMSQYHMGDKVKLAIFKNK